MQENIQDNELVEFDFSKMYKLIINEEKFVAKKDTPILETKKKIVILQGKLAQEQNSIEKFKFKSQLAQQYYQLGMSLEAANDYLAACVLYNKSYEITGGYSLAGKRLRFIDQGKKSNSSPNTEKYYIKDDLSAQEYFKLGLQALSGIGLQCYDECLAFSYVKKAAGMGYTAAEYHLGLMYFDSVGTSKDDVKAVEWIRKAALKGYVMAQTDLAEAYAFATGIEQDDKQAAQWFIKSAVSGDVLAQFNLATMYANGRGLLQDDTLAIYWYQKAMEQGCEDAQFDLRNMYSENRLAHDKKKDFNYYLKTAERGFAPSEYFLGFFYSTGTYVECDITKALFWYQKSAEHGNSAALYDLAKIYLHGKGIKQDINKALKLYREAASKEGLAASHAQNSLGVMYQQGTYVAKCDTEALAWYRKAAQNGSVFAVTKLGSIYEHGRGVEVDKSRAVKYYRVAAKKGSSSAQSRLGIMYRRGWGVEEDNSLANYWFNKVAEKGDAVAQYNLALSYLSGDGVEQDYVQAFSLFRKAAEQGLVQAQYNLAIMYKLGHGTKLNDIEAFKWYYEAALRKHNKSEFEVGIIYFYGRGITRDYNEAQLWFIKFLMNPQLDKTNEAARINELTECFNEILQELRKKAKGRITSSFVDCLLTSERFNIFLKNYKSISLLYRLVKYLNYSRLMQGIELLNEEIAIDFTPRNYQSELLKLTEATWTERTVSIFMRAKVAKSDTRYQIVYSVLKYLLVQFRSELGNYEEIDLSAIEPIELIRNFHEVLRYFKEDSFVQEYDHFINDVNTVITKSNTLLSKLPPELLVHVCMFATAYPDKLSLPVRSSIVYEKLNYGT